MDMQSSKRCPHYQMMSEPLDIEGPTSYLAVRRCTLTERLIVLLRQSEEGGQLADKLVINLMNGRSFAFAGPDLEAVTQRSCTVKRCEERCTPAYAHLLDLFGLTDPREEEVTCADAEETREQASDYDTSEKPEPCPTCP